jgi:hypothetical protein
MHTTSTTHEGWTNFETWAVNLWINNDRGSYEHYRELAEIALEDTVESYEGKLDKTAREEATGLLAQRVRGEVEAAAPELGGTLYSDLLNAALSKVDWLEIAAAFFEDFEPDETSGEGDQDDEDAKAFEAIKRERQARQGQPLFDLGRTVSTPGALDALTLDEIATAFSRHANGDWGDVCREDWEENELSLREGFRLLSVYHTARGAKFYVITEANRSATTVLLPSEY